MKRYLFTFVLLIRIAYGQPSVTSDTLCFKIDVIQKVLIAASQKKVLEQQIGILNERIAGCQSQLALMISKDSLTVSGFQKQQAVYEQEKKILLDQIGVLNRTIRKYKRRQFFTAAGGVLITGITTYLYLTK